MTAVTQPGSTARVAIGTMISEISTPSIVAILGRAGFDHVVVDCEHGPFSYAEVAAMVWAGRAAHIPVHVRIPEINRECVGRFLDLGVAGLVAPMVSDPEQAARLVALAHYPPGGSRGVSTQRAHSGYRVDDLASYLASANASVELQVQIETAAAVERVADIAAVPGITGLVVGPNDLLVDLGLPGRHDHPRLVDAISTVAVAADRAGIRSGVISSRPALLEHAHRAGMETLVWNSEIGLLLGPVSARLTELRDQLTEPQPNPGES